MSECSSSFGINQLIHQMSLSLIADSSPLVTDFFTYRCRTLGFPIKKRSKRQTAFLKKFQFTQLYIKIKKLHPKKSRNHNSSDPCIRSIKGYLRESNWDKIILMPFSWSPRQLWHKPRLSWCSLVLRSPGYRWGWHWLEINASSWCFWEQVVRHYPEIK